VSLQTKVELQAMCSWQEPGYSHSYSHDAHLLDTTVPSLRGPTSLQVVTAYVSNKSTDVYSWSSAKAAERTILC